MPCTRALKCHGTADSIEEHLRVDEILTAWLISILTLEQVYDDHDFPFTNLAC